MTVTPKQINELPLNGRNFMELALLAPGVKVPLERTSTDVSFGASSGRSTYVQVDGADNNDDTVGGGETSFSMESIREFQVVTNRFSSDFGRTSAGVVNIVTRSGTNDLRGGAFGFFRDDSLKAANLFTGTRVPFSRKQFGGMVGGPILKNRMHYFVSVERQKDAETAVPNTGFAYLDTPVDTNNEVDLPFVKIDHRISGNHRLFTSYAATYTETTNQNIGGSATIEYGTHRIRKTHSGTVGETWVLSNRAVNDFRFLYRDHDTQASANVNKPALLFPSAMLGTRTNYPQNRTEERLQFSDDFWYFVPDWKGTHNFKMGFDWPRQLHGAVRQHYTRCVHIHAEPRELPGSEYVSGADALPAGPRPFRHRGSHLDVQRLSAGRLAAGQAAYAELRHALRSGARRRQQQLRDDAQRSRQAEKDRHEQHWSPPGLHLRRQRRRPNGHSRRVRHLLRPVHPEHVVQREAVQRRDIRDR